jgi:hypothetical protein
MLIADQACREIADFHPNLLVAGITKDAEFVASYFKKLVWKPKPERLRVMLGQMILMTGIPKLNEDFFGKIRVVTAQHDNLHVLMFPLTTTMKHGATHRAAGTVNGLQGGECILVVVIMPPFNHQELVCKILNYLEATNFNMH